MSVATNESSFMVVSKVFNQTRLAFTPRASDKSATPCPLSIHHLVGTFKSNREVSYDLAWEGNKIISEETRFQYVVGCVWPVKEFWIRNGW
jgi:hypothetical protein